MKERFLRMKKVTSIVLFALLMAMFAPSAMFGQDELTVFEGSETNREVPMYVYYFDDYTRAQTVYPATELADMTGGQITAIKFYTTTSDIPYTTVSEFDVYLTEVDDASISSFVDRNDATTVYSGTGEFVSIVGGGEITITFSEPYTYNGGNLLFGCDNITDSGYKEIYFYGQSSSGASISGYNGTAGGTISPTQRNFIPKTTFLYELPCRRPRDLAVTLDDSDATMATLDWTEAGEATHWVLQTATNTTFTEGLQTYEVSGNPTKDLTGLIPETRYYARVKAICRENEESNWSNVINFRPSNTIPLTVNEGDATNECVPVYGYYVDEYQKSEFIIPATTEGLAAMTDGTINQMTFYLSSPAEKPWKNAQFQVFLKEVSATEFFSDYLGNLFYGTDNATIVYEGSLDGTQSTMTFDFTTNYHYNGGNLLVGVYETTKGTFSRAYFVGTTATGGSLRNNNSSSLESMTTGNIEDFLPKTTFNYLPSNTPKPANLHASDISSSGATLSWTAATDNVTSYQYQYKEDSGNWTALESTANNSVSLSGLTELTSYTFRVKAIYSEGESDFASITFTTKQIPVIVDLEHPFEDDFEGEQCDWGMVNGNLANAWAWGNAVNNGGEKALYISDDEGASNAYTTDSSAVVYAVKSFTLEQGAYNFTYDWKANGESTYDYLRVALIPDAIELAPSTKLPSGFGTSQLPESWIALDGGSQLNNSEEWNTLLIETTVPVAGIYKMAFIWRNDNSYGSNPPAAVDNINISKVSCQTPMDFNYSNLTAFTATLGWSANGSETSWEIEYRVEGENEWQTLTVYENPYTLEGLDELTTYEARVRAICEGNAAATLPITFTTKQIPVVVDLDHPFTENFEGGQCDWDLVNGNLANAWAWGNAVNNGGEKALYISDDEGTSNAYTTNSSTVVYAVKSFALEQGAYDFTYDWKANGESTYDYLRVALIPDAIELAPSTELPSDFGTSQLPEGWFALDGGTKLNMSTEWNTYFVEVVVPTTGEYKMAFIWCNDNTAGSNPPAAVDNISISRVWCPMPTELAHTEITDTSVTLSWTVNGTEEAWEIEYREEGETEWQTMTAYENPYTLEGLSEQTTYEVRVSAVCAGTTTPTQIITFTTRCEVISVDLQHPFTDGFETYGFPSECWESVPYTDGANTRNWSRNTNYKHSGSASAYSGFYGPIYLYTPTLHIGQDALYVELSFWSCVSAVSYYTGGTSGNHDGLSIVKVSTDYGMTWTQLWCPSIEELPTTTTWERISLNLTNYKNQDLLIAFEYQGNDAHGWYIDDVAVTVYDKVFVGGNAEDATAWFNADNWQPEGVPTIEQDVVISASAVISASETATANFISVAEQGTLTIANGGQLLHNNEGVQATVQRTISTYIGENDNYYLIASPFANDLAINNPDQANLITNNYDLYLFDQYYDLEWRNYKNDEFTTLSNGIGYLYANSGEEGQTTYAINLSGELKPSNTDKSVDLDYYNVVFAGWNLVGNPFACNAYIGQDFYHLGEDGVDATPAFGAIAPMEGIFVKATGTNQSVTFSRNEPEGNGNKGTLNVNVMRKGNRVDLARVRFGVGQDLEKFQLNPNHTKVVIPQGGKDYAVAYSESGTGEMPISFKAETNGTYTLDFSNEEVTFSYLHLIDNLAGIDVDLLQTPTYTFEAKTTDYASRFRLMFNAEDGPSTGSGTFAFVIDGNIIVNGEGILQVVDAMGRVIIQGDAMNRVSTSGITSGVYVLRLVNGNNVKTQKIVIR